MHRKRSGKTRARRPAAPAAGARSAARVAWYSRDRRRLALVFVLGAVAGAAGFLTYSVLASANDRNNLNCLAQNVYFEARGEPTAGQYAVAEVTMNRVASGRFPDTVCGVVHEKRWDPIRERYVGGFSWTDLRDRPAPQGEEWQRAWKIAEEVYYRNREPDLDGATYFHATYVRPTWSQEKTVVARIGRHVFYK
jgi:spore germination cell wall hydrolase CwlJ-like protein